MLVCCARGQLVKETISNSHPDLGNAVVDIDQFIVLQLLTFAREEGSKGRKRGKNFIFSNRDIDTHSFCHFCICLGRMERTLFSSRDIDT